MRKKLLWIAFTIMLIFSFFSVDTTKITAQETRDIAVVSVTPSQTSVRLGELVNITVVVENQGTSNETFNATVYYDTTAIETQNITNLGPNTSTFLIFTWNTTEVEQEIYAEDGKEKTYTINATASIVSNETDTEDNTLVSNSTVIVRAHYIAVIPQSTVDPTLTPGKNYTVSIYTDYNGSDVWGWQFRLTYNPNILEGIEITNGDLITTAKDSSAQFIPGTFNNTAGTLSLTTAYFQWLPPATPFETSGPGILANVTFRVKGTGDSFITLVEQKTELRNPKDGFPGIIINNILPQSGHILHGYFQNKEVIHDVAVTSVTPSKTSVLEGEFVNITVVVENQGTTAETFDVAVWYDYIGAGTLLTQRIGKKTVTNLENGTSTTLTFTWDTTGVKAGAHTITAVVTVLEGETDTADNTLKSAERVTVTGRPATPIPLELLIGTVIVIVVIAVVVYALRRRKKPTLE